MEDEMVGSFKDDGFNEGDMEVMDTESFPFRYKLTGRFPISKAYLIVPKHIYINGSEEYFQEFRDFRIRCSRKTVVVESKRVGIFHLSVVRKGRGRDKRAVTQSNMILSAGMTSSCDNVCDPKKKECKTDPCKYLPMDNIECPPNNDCNIISHDASIYNISGVPHTQPIGNAVVVKTCDDFIEAVCEKFNRTGGKVDVYVDAHGNHGFFVIGMYDGPKEYVYKGSDCYKKICMKLKDKIKTLTLFSCSTAGGVEGPPFLKCLANCLNAKVKAWKKTLYIQAAWNTTNISSIVWSTARNYTTPCEATPCPTPTTTISMNTPTPTPTPTPPPTTTYTTKDPTTTYMYTETSTEDYSLYTDYNT